MNSNFTLVYIGSEEVDSVLFAELKYIQKYPVMIFMCCHAFDLISLLIIRGVQVFEPVGVFSSDHLSDL